MTIGFEASAMPFGKRGLVRDEERPDIAASLPVLPPNPNALEWLYCLWRLCKVLPFGLGQGVISYGYHVLASVVLSIAILFINQDALSRFAEAMTPYWPLLSRAQPYMDVHGHHELFLYMGAMYFKDMALIAIFSARNTFWIVASFIMISSKTKICLRRRTFLVGLITPLALAFWVTQLYYGPAHDVLHRSVYDGNVYWGIVFPALLLNPILVLVSFYSAFLMFFPSAEGEIRILSKIKQIKN